MLNTRVDTFMRSVKELALTFDDVTLITQYADFLPSETSLETRFSRNVKLNIPFASAAMDTVTEARMAIEMARLGGIGVIHRGMTPCDQARHVAKVKHYLNGLIDDPIFFNENQTVDEVLAVKEKKGYGFLGFPIVNDQNTVTGIITSRDIRFLKKTNIKIKKAMTTELITAPPSTTLNQAFNIMRTHKVGKLPILKRGKLVGLYSYTDVRNIIEGIEPLINRDKKHRLRVAAAVGTNDHDRIDMLVAEAVDVIVIDTAHGHSKGVCEMVKFVKKQYPVIDVVAGNVATREGARDLVKAGADGVKVGVGPGSICTTRVITGVGIPQITAVYEALQGVKDQVPIISDGGIRHSGDVPKALVAGASAVMMGSVLAGTDESPGEKIFHQGRQFVVYRGMGSLGAMADSQSSRERYAQHDVKQTDKLVPEGIEGLVPYAGHVEGVIQQYAGGLRSSLGYNGCRSVQELRKNGRFKRITPAGVREAHPHDVRISKEAPNYRTALNS
jgi:IMP dehydrogenase